MIRNNHDTTVIRNRLQKLANFVIQQLMIIDQYTQIRLQLANFIDIRQALWPRLPESVLGSIKPNFHHHHELPVPTHCQVSGQCKTLASHSPEVIFQTVFVVRPEIQNVEFIGGHGWHIGDFRLEFGWPCVGRFSGRGQKIGDKTSFDRLWRICLGDSDEKRLNAGSAEMIPDTKCRA